MPGAPYNDRTAIALPWYSSDGATNDMGDWRDTQEVSGTVGLSLQGTGGEGGHEDEGEGRGDRGSGCEVKIYQPHSNGCETNSNMQISCFRHGLGATFNNSWMPVLTNLRKLQLNHALLMIPNVAPGLVHLECNSLAA